MTVVEETYTEIGAFDAKTKLSEILRKVEQGERFTITVRGRAVANLRRPWRHCAVFPRSRAFLATRFWSGFAKEESKWNWFLTPRRRLPGW